MAGLSAKGTAGIAIVVGVSTLVLGWPIGAGAQDLTIEIPLVTVVRGPEGSEHVLAAAEVPGDLVGSECLVTAVATNQRSIHPGNDLVVSSNGDELVVEDVEGEAFGEGAVEGSLILGTELTVTLVLGPDGVFSAGMVVEVRCPAPETTTTTVAETTTTTVAETTTTTVPETTTTTVPETTTTTVPETTTTTVPETTTTAVLGTTTTTEPTTTTIAETTTTGATSTTDSTLPLTGAGGVAAAGVVGLVGVVTGMGLLLLTRRVGADRSGLGHAGHTYQMIDGIPVTLIRPGHADPMIEGVRVRLIRPGD